MQETKFCRWCNSYTIHNSGEYEFDPEEVVKGFYCEKCGSFIDDEGNFYPKFDAVIEDTFDNIKTWN